MGEPVRAAMIYKMDEDELWCPQCHSYMWAVEWDEAEGVERCTQCDTALFLSTNEDKPNSIHIGGVFFRVPEWY